MNKHRYVPSLSPLEPRALLAGPVNLLDPVLPPNDGGGGHPIIITPFNPPPPHLPPNPQLA